MTGRLRQLFANGIGNGARVCDVCDPQQIRLRRGVENAKRTLIARAAAHRAALRKERDPLPPLLQIQTPRDYSVRPPRIERASSHRNRAISQSFQ